MKTKIILFSLCMISINCFSQVDEFYVGIFAYDYDNYSGCAKVPGTDLSIGNDSEYLRLLKDYGINLVIPSWQLVKPSIQYASSSPSKVFLDRANSVNLKVLLECPDIHIDNAIPVYDAVKCNEGINYYGTHSSLCGWFIKDEPSTTHFDAIKKYAEAIKNSDSKKLDFINLFPTYANKDQLFKNGDYSASTFDDYTNYVHDFLQKVNPRAFSFDNYPIGGGGDFFYNLDIIGKESSSFNIPFLSVIAPYKNFNESTYLADGQTASEFNFTIFSSLVYGAKGIIIWPRETACFTFDEIVIGDTKTHFKSLSEKLIKNGNTLLKLTFKSAYHKSVVSTLMPGTYIEIPSHSTWINFKDDIYAKEIFDINNPLVAQNGSKTTNLVISFLMDSNGNYYFWIFNKSLIDNEYIQMNFNETTALVDILNNKIYAESSSRIVYLEPGEAKLFEVSKNYQSNISICNKTYYAGAYSDVWAENIYIGGSSCNVQMYNGSKLDFKGDKITIGNGVRVYEGSKISFTGLDLSNGTIKSALTLQEESKESLVEEETTEMRIYPNPNNGQFTINISNSESIVNSVQIFNIMGIKVTEFSDLNSNITNINLDNRLKGTFIIRVNSGSDCYHEIIVVR